MILEHLRNHCKEHTEGRNVLIASNYGFWIQTLLKSYLDKHFYCYVVKLLNRVFFLKAEKGFDVQYLGYCCSNARGSNLIEITGEITCLLILQ